MVCFCFLLPSVSLRRFLTQSHNFLFAAGSYLCSGSDDQRIGIINFESRKFVRIQTSHTENIFSTKFLPTTNSDQIVSCAGDGVVEYHIVSKNFRRPYSCHTARAKKLQTFPSGSALVFLGQQVRENIVLSCCRSLLFHIMRRGQHGAPVRCARAAQVQPRSQVSQCGGAHAHGAQLHLCRPAAPAPARCWRRLHWSACLPACLSSELLLFHVSSSSSWSCLLSRDARV